MSIMYSELSKRKFNNVLELVMDVVSSIIEHKNHN